MTNTQLLLSNAAMFRPIPTWSQADTDAMVAEVRRINREMDMYLAQRRRLRNQAIARRLAWLALAIAMTGLALWSLQ